MIVTPSPDELRPIIEQVVLELRNRFGPADRLAYREDEAAALLGVNSHVLRDARLQGKIKGAKIGRSYSYTRDDLLRFIESRKAAADNGHD